MLLVVCPGGHSLIICFRSNVVLNYEHGQALPPHSFNTTRIAIMGKTSPSSTLDSTCTCIFTCKTCSKYF